MKKTIIISALCVGAVSAYSQGTVSFADRQADISVHIFAPQLLTPSVEVTGDQGTATVGATTGGVATDIYYNNTTDGNYAGTAVQGSGAPTTTTYGGATVYTGGAIGNTLASNPTAAGAYHFNNGSDYTVELFAAPGLGAAASSLLPVSQYVTTIYTSSTLGGAFKNVIPGSDPGIPNTLPAGNATIALVAWYNGGVSPVGLSQTALTAQYAGSPVTGMSPLDSIALLGGTLVGGIAQTAPDMQGLQSFSLVSAPEPSTIALGVIGASAFLFRRRK
jgi:hypothetical protein